MKIEQFYFALSKASLSTPTPFCYVIKRNDWIERMKYGQKHSYTGRVRNSASKFRKYVPFRLENTNM